MPNGTGRRKHERVKATVLLNLYRPGQYVPLARACISDISLSGSAIESTVQLEKDEGIVLVFTLPNNRQYILEGMIRWVKRSTGTFSYGVEFTRMNFFKKLKLRYMIPVLARAGER